jgi:hypothetical protein
MTAAGVGHNSDRIGMIRQLISLALLAVCVSGCGGGMLGGSSPTASPSADSVAGEGAAASQNPTASESPPPGPSRSPSLTDRITGFFDTGGSSQPQQRPGSPPLAQSFDCPAVTVREGTSTLVFHASREQTPLNLRYQATVRRIARECRVVGTSVIMRVGVEGMVILGPAGGPGKIDIPLRFGVVEEGPVPKAITSKFYRIPVTIGGDRGNVPFVQIEDALTFPLVPASQLENYVVYVGFDPEGLKPQARPARRTQR